MSKERTFEVYDSQNKSRLLGTIEVHQKIRGYRHGVTVMPYMSIGRPVAVYPDATSEMRADKITFDVETRSKTKSFATGPFYRQTVTDEWEVLETSATLETLMKIDSFRLPGENNLAAEWRRHTAHHSSDY